MKSKLIKFLLVIPIVFLLLISCERDDPEPLLPTIDNVEVGLNNNEIGVVDRDLHFNAEILAGDKIDLVQIKIEPIEGETYASPWSYEITWDEFKGVKNATVHKHFDIPEDAVEGYYSFIIVITDENGTLLEEKRNITIYTAESLPVDPQVRNILVYTHDDPKRYLFNFTTGTGDKTLKIDELTSVQASVKNVKGDGKMYVVLINKKHNHKPESIDDIDYSKTIIWDIDEHKDIENTTNFKNYTTDFTSVGIIIKAGDLLIGTGNDNNLPTANPITGGDKAWESGDYYLGLLYENTTYNMGLFYYIEVSLGI
ncbi:DUF4625 domain-containing protein [Pseudotamlana agarivorans]|uniref:DUF4625 domain-containing protein n=1 Tax=Pseudotamlana agarivorans TaxID=481183 RepID=UPI000831179B|nr:DUF4625 domain-containing protein [Tamlana agarivorans]